MCFNQLKSTSLSKFWVSDVNLHPYIEAAAEAAAAIAQAGARLDGAGGGHAAKEDADDLEARHVVGTLGGIDPLLVHVSSGTTTHFRSNTRPPRVS